MSIKLQLNKTLKKYQVVQAFTLSTLMVTQVFAEGGGGGGGIGGNGASGPEPSTWLFTLFGLIILGSIAAYRTYSKSKVQA